jgi:hypothetical protein
VTCFSFDVVYLFPIDLAVCGSLKRIQKKALLADESHVRHRLFKNVLSSIAKVFDGCFGELLVHNRNDLV